MKLKIVLAFKIKNEFYKALLNDYVSRIKWYIPIEIIETLKVEDYLKPEFFKIILHEKGEEFDSIGFSSFLSKTINNVNKDIYFFVGGAVGFNKNILEKANMLLSLSKFTFPHELAAVILTEQIYRSLTILNNEKYHK